MSWRLALPLGVGALALGGWSAGRRAEARARVEVAAESQHEAAVRTADIEFFEARAAGDPYGAGDRARLASLLLARARAGGRFEDLVAAEQHARESLGLRRGRNRGAALVLANALMGQHRFREALVVAQGLEAEDSTDPTASSLTGEILLELGEYPEAGRRLSSMSYATNLAAQMRVARWDEVTGKVEDAHRLILDARERSLRNYELSREQRAWFEVRVAEFALRYGHGREARTALERGFAVDPDDYRLLYIAARESLERQDWPAAVDYASRSMEQHFDPAALAVVVRAERARGDTAAAGQALHAMVTAIKAQPGAWHRAWSLALLDERQETAAVLEQARQDLETRQDVYGWDLYAWALYASGDREGARRAISHALVTGIQDPQILSHAATIRGG